MSTTLQKAYFWSGTILPAVSVIGYAGFPAGTVTHFGGTPTHSAKMWCSLVASADVLHSYLCFEMLRNPDDKRLKKVVVRGCFLYSLFHFGAFWYWTVHGEKERAPVFGKKTLSYVASLLTQAAALIAWGCEPSRRAPDFLHSTFCACSGVEK